MAAAENQFANLPDALIAQVEKIARDEGRSVGDVLTDAVSRYVRDQQWQALKNYGQARSQESGLSEPDVPRLIAEYRGERTDLRVTVPK